MERWPGFAPYCPTVHYVMCTSQSSINASNMALLLGSSLQRRTSIELIPSRERRSASSIWWSYPQTWIRYTRPSENVNEWPAILRGYKIYTQAQIQPYTRGLQSLVSSNRGNTQSQDKTSHTIEVLHQSTETGNYKTRVSVTWRGLSRTASLSITGTFPTNHSRNNF